MLRLYDAHNHLQDQRLAPFRPAILESIPQSNIVAMVVNGSCEGDWPEVLALAQQCPWVIPSFGYHPWYVKERSQGWLERLREFLDRVPSAIGEVGLDRWIKDYDFPSQEQVFVEQWRLAAERDLPVSIHCLQAWGKLFEWVRSEPRLRCGFVLHSFGGPAELIKPLADLGAFFSLPGYFAHERKARQQAAFRQVPRERLLIETDAPDQCLPAAREQFQLQNTDTGQPLNHPANLRAVYEFAAELRGESLETLAAIVEENFLRVFGRFIKSASQRM
jgi:TatD DNase family protein